MSAKQKSSLAIHATIGIAMKNGCASIEEMAGKMGVKRPQLSRWAGGGQQPSLENFFKMCEAAGAVVSIENGEDDSPKLKL